MNMQLRTVKKQKNRSLDYLTNTQTEHRQIPINKEQNEKEGNTSSGEVRLLFKFLIKNSNSNLTIENETKSRHKLRNTSNNYHGKYKKMNSGKYLYKLNSSDKKPVVNKKKQLRLIPYELVGTFKKFLNKLNKKEEENLLNKKKKREESKELIKKGVEGQKKMSTKLQNFNQFHPMANVGNNFDYQPYMMKNPYEMYYPPNMIENMKSRAFPMDDQQFMYRMNKDFVRFLQMPPDYYYRGQYPGGHPYQYEQEMPKPKNESIFNLINDKENLNRINKIANEGLNHIVAAFYIKSVQQSRNAKQNENSHNLVRKSSLQTVNIVDDGSGHEINKNDEKINNFIQQSDSNNINENLNNFNKNSNNNNTNLTNTQFFSNSDDSPLIKNSNNNNFNNKTGNVQETISNNKFNNYGINLNHTNMFNDKFTSDINEFTANQLNTVNDVVKKLKENKISEIVDKDYLNMSDFTNNTNQNVSNTQNIAQL